MTQKMTLKKQQITKTGKKNRRGKTQERIKKRKHVTKTKKEKKQETQ